VQNSCNIAFITIGQKVGAARFYDYLERFGLLAQTGIDMQGEGSSVIWPRSYFTSAEGATSLAVASFGQTAKFTPIQLITAYAAVANGGYLLKPYVVSRVTAEAGTVLVQNERTVVRQVISSETSEKVRSILESVVTVGTGKNAYVAGYRIAGKTGTSEKRDEDTGDNFVSFLGFAPADDPEVVVLLAYDSPTPTSRGSNYTSRGYYISGGNMAALMAGPLIADILDYMGVEKQYTASELQGIDTAVPGVVSQSLAAAESRMKEAGFTVRTVGGGDVVTDQIPAAGALIPVGSEVVLYLGEAKPTDLVAVPNVTNLSAEAANRALTNAGLYMKAPAPRPAPSPSGRTMPPAPRWSAAPSSRCRWPSRRSATEQNVRQTSPDGERGGARRRRAARHPEKRVSRIAGFRFDRHCVWRCPMRLSALLPALSPLACTANPETEITALTHASGEVVPVRFSPPFPAMSPMAMTSSARPRTAAPRPFSASACRVKPCPTFSSATAARRSPRSPRSGTAGPRTASRSSASRAPTAKPPPPISSRPCSRARSARRPASSAPSTTLLETRSSPPRTRHLRRWSFSACSGAWPTPAAPTWSWRSPPMPCCCTAWTASASPRASLRI
jgi:hypothetical protein